MLIIGDVTMDARRDKGWDFHTNPSKISQCISGVAESQSMEKLKKDRGIAWLGHDSVQSPFHADPKFRIVYSLRCARRA
jgi:hypothetical protein